MIDVPTTPYSAARQVLALGLIVAVCFVAAGIGSVASPGGLDPWYAALVKPSWTPPDAVFPVVWSVLYLLMGLAAWLVWRRGVDRVEVTSALSAFSVQLILNATWPWAFFWAQSPALGLSVLAALLLALIVTMRRFAAVSPLAAWLLVPYLLWGMFAATLNAAILVMN